VARIKAVTVDLDAAARFMAGRARVLDRRRFGVLLGNGDAIAFTGARSVQPAQCGPRAACTRL
jgi:hypothetical protein